MDITKQTFFISLDLAKTNDYSALAIVERCMQYPDRRGAHWSQRYIQPYPKEFYLRHLERIAPGTTYPEILDKIKLIYESPELSECERALIIGFSGVGQPVWDMMQNDGFRHRLNGILIASGDEVTREHLIYRVPKQDLIAATQIELQKGTLRFAKDVPEAETLAHELSNFDIMQHEVHREGANDGIVLALAMAIWAGTQQLIKTSDHI
ncbi:MAG: hypothetical protein FWC75_06340 [Oscillospiraceae bacterium]|nr:hypothetical protein [Oscillospiraceae bacterium]